jgi:hypothetical protein
MAEAPANRSATNFNDIFSGAFLLLLFWNYVEFGTKYLYLKLKSDLAGFGRVSLKQSKQKHCN